MSDEELEDFQKAMSDLIDEEDLQLPSLEAAPSTSHAVQWLKRDSEGNPIYGRPRSGRKPSVFTTRPASTGGNQKTTEARGDQSRDLELTSADDSFQIDTIESFLQELQQSLDDPALQSQDDPVQERPRSSTDWSFRKSLSAERWEKERPRLVNAMVGRQNTTSRVCQKCGTTPAVIRCHDCLPHSFLCADCDVEKHSALVLHNRDTMIAGFFQPLPPTTCVVEGALCHCVRLVPLEMPEKICSCPPGSLHVKAGKSLSVISINGRFDLSLPEIHCGVCQATWAAGVDDLIYSDYWPATLNVSTMYATDIFFSFEELKMASPGLSFQAFLKMLDQRTSRFGRTGKICADTFRQSFFEWEAARFEMDRKCKEEYFVCPACTPKMLAASVDGNRKHYRFKNAARSEGHALFEGVFIAKDEDVETFVQYIHSTTKHVSGRGVCGGEWTAARETSAKSRGKVDEEGLELAVCRHGVFLQAINMFRGEIFAYPLYLQNQLACQMEITFFAMDVTCKYWPYLMKVVKSCPELQHLLSMKPFLSVFHAKAHDFKCEVKWSGAYQDGAGLTLGEEVEQCNAFLSRIAVQTKHMSKTGRTDMLTLMAMRWNQQKFHNLATTLCRRYQKASKALECQTQTLESVKAEMEVTEEELENWAKDVKEWADANSTPEDGDVGALASRIEILVANIKRRSQRLYKDNDGSKGRARIRRKIREEKGTLTSVVERYNSMVPDTESLCLETILSTEALWPWQRPHGGSVDLRSKRRAFDIIMSIRRLAEEKDILVAEMEQHWRSLLRQEETLKELLCTLRRDRLEGELWGLREEGTKGLQCVLLKKQQQISETRKHVRSSYLQVLSGRDGPPMPFDSSDDSDSELSD